MKGVTAKIHTNPGVIPKFHMDRLVPSALLVKVEADLESLQTQGVIKSVQFSDWAAAILPVLKSDGDVHICGD